MLEKNDIEILDEIIEKLIKSNSKVCYNDFSNHRYFSSTNHNHVCDKFQRLIDIIINYDCAKLIKAGYYNSLIANQNTVHFKENGGFAKAYQEQQTRIEKETEIQTISMNKLRLDTKLSKWQVKTFWWFFSFSLVGFIYGFYDFITDLKSDKSLNKIEISNRQLESELSKLRTLFLDQKSVDSLHNSKTDVDTLSVH
jgi:hypothetical protein